MEVEGESAFIGIPMKKYETAKQHEQKNVVFLKVYEDSGDYDLAVRYTNIWFNMAFLKSRYSDELERKVMVYSPEGYEIPKR